MSGTVSVGVRVSREMFVRKRVNPLVELRSDIFKMAGELRGDVLASSVITGCGQRCGPL
jgi:hypothetical protein